MDEVKVDKRTKEYKESVQDEVETDYSKAENNPGFKLCMMCGAELPPNEDGTSKWRPYPEACRPCVFKNYHTTVENA